MQDMTNPTSQQKASLIGSELQKAEQACAGVPMSVGMLSIKSANLTLTEASMTANPKQLYGEFWFEHEIGCLFADSNVGSPRRVRPSSTSISSCRRSSSSFVSPMSRAISTTSRPRSTVCSPT